MNKDVSHPTPAPLYRIAHPAIRQLGCPTCKSPNISLELHKTVVMKGPVEHDELGSVVGSVFSVIGKCEDGHYFILRIANHRKSVLVWTDVVRNIHEITDKPIVPFDKPMAKGNAIGMALDKLEESGIENYPTYMAMQKHQPPLTSHGAPSDGDDTQCHADQVLIGKLRAKFSALLYAKRDKLSSGDRAKLLAELRSIIGGAASRRMQKYPQIQYSVHVVATLADMLRDCNFAESTNKRITLLIIPIGTQLTPEFMNGTEPGVPSASKPGKKLATSAAKVPQLKDNSIVLGCPDNLTVGTAKTNLCQSLFCASCASHTCIMHPKNKPKI